MNEQPGAVALVRDACPQPERPHSSSRPRRRVFETQFRYPGHDTLRAIAREEANSTGVLTEREALVLLETGVKGLARETSCSERTVRRRLRSASCPPRAFVRRMRIRMTMAAISARVP